MAQDPLDALLKKHGIESATSDPLDELLKKHGLDKEAPKEPPTFLSRATEALTGFGDFVKNIAQAPFNPAAGARIAEGAVAPFTQPGLHPHERVAMLAGFDPNAIREDYGTGNYGALAADIAIPAALELLPGAIGKIGKRASKIPLPEVLPPEVWPPPSARNTMRGRALPPGPLPDIVVPRETLALPPAPEPRGLLPARGETTIVPDDLFVAGSQGVADPRMQYLIEPDTFVGQRDVIGQVNRPVGLDESASLRQAITPDADGTLAIRPTQELPPPVNIGPFLAASGRGLPRPISEFFTPSRLAKGEGPLVSEINLPTPPGMPRPDLPVLEHPVGGAVVDAPRVRPIGDPNIIQDVSVNTQPGGINLFRGPNRNPSVLPPNIIQDVPYGNVNLPPINLGKKSRGVQQVPLSLKDKVKLKEKLEQAERDELFKSVGLPPTANIVEDGGIVSNATRHVGTKKPYDLTRPGGRLLEALRTAVPLTRQQREMYRVERASRIGRALESSKNPKLSGTEARNRYMGALKGEYEKIRTDVLKLSQRDIDALYKQIVQGPEAIGFEKAQAIEGLNRLLTGQVPRASEIRQLAKVFGPEIINEIHGSMSFLQKGGRVTGKVVNIPRAIVASLDFSFPLRQGLGLMHKGAWWKSWGPMFKAYASEGGYKAIKDAIEADPNFRFAKEAGIKFSDNLDDTINDWVEKIYFGIPTPTGGKIRPIRASNRAYNAFANKLRFDTFKSLIGDLEKSATAMLKVARNADEIKAAELANPRKNLVLAKELANFVNNASGAGNLGRFERNVGLLANTFFSPRLIASRVRMLDPRNYITKPAAVRKEYLKSFLTIAGSWITISSLAKMAGGEVSLEPTSADFGKIKIGNARLDPSGGFQNYLVAFYRTMMPESMGGAKFTSSTTGHVRQIGKEYAAPSKLDVMLDFASNKMTPTLKFAWDLYDASPRKPFDSTVRMRELYTPMVAQDSYVD